MRGIQVTGLVNWTRIFQRSSVVEAPGAKQKSVQRRRAVVFTTRFSFAKMIDGPHCSNSPVQSTIFMPGKFQGWAKVYTAFDEETINIGEKRSATCILAFEAVWHATAATAVCSRQYAATASSIFGSLRLGFARCIHLHPDASCGRNPAIKNV